MRYSNSTLCFAFMVFIKSPSCYRFIRKSDVLCLPHPVTLKKLASPLTVGTSHSEVGNYLSLKAAKLSETEKVVSVLMDEIHVKASVSYTGGRLIGTAENRKNAAESATTVQAFMVSSAFGSYSDVVRLVPMLKMDATDLLENLNAVIKCVQESGFLVLGVFADNNSINRKVYKELKKQYDTPTMTYIPNPQHPDKQLFLMFDSVHIVKCVRNNWINQKDRMQTLTFPNLGFGVNGENEDPVQACFSHLKDLYFKEQNNIAKLAPTLSQKALFPSNLDRQKVPLALAIFNDYNVAALRLCEGDVFKKHTADFIERILKWWHVVNVKSKFVGNITRNDYAKPITSVNDKQVLFLKEFCTWLQKWNALPLISAGGKLTNETHTAMLQTTQAIVDLIAYCFFTFDIQYILLGKLQTDNLEGRFGEYRQLSGANYLVSVQQVLEAEKKLRVHSLLCMNSSSFGEVHIRDISSSLGNHDSESEVAAAEMKSVYFELSPEDCEVLVSPGTEDALTYIAGYVSHKACQKLSCMECKAVLCTKKNMLVEYDREACLPFDYIQLMDRGGLTYPSQIAALVTFMCYCVMQNLISPAYENKFLSCTAHKGILMSLVRCSVTKYASIDGVCTCGTSRAVVAFSVLPYLTNIFLNNYCKAKNDQPADNRRKTRKFAKPDFTPKAN